MRRTIEITNLNGNQGFAVASSQLPMDLDYFVFYWVNTTPGITVANLPNMKLYMNSDLVRDYTGTFQDEMNQVDTLDAYAVDNIMVMHLDQLGMKSITATYGTTMATLSPDPQTGLTITNARVELTADGGVSPNWRLFADVDDSGNGGPGFVERVKTYGGNNIGTSERAYDNVLPFGTLDVRFWRRLFMSNFQGGPTTITLGRLLVASKQNEVFKRTTPLDARILADYGVRQLAGSVNFLIDGTETGIAEMFDSMRMIPKKSRVPNGPRIQSMGLMSLRLAADAAGQVDISLDTIGQL